MAPVEGRNVRTNTIQCAPWIFIHGTDIVDRGLIVLFFVFFFAIFWSFFPLLPLPGNVSADALAWHLEILNH